MDYKYAIITVLGIAAIVQVWMLAGYFEHSTDWQCFLHKCKMAIGNISDLSLALPFTTVRPMGSSPARFTHRIPFKIMQYPPRDTRDINRLEGQQTGDSGDDTPKVILDWSRTYGRKGGVGGTQIFSGCEYKNCRLEFDGSFAETADCILFNNRGQLGNTRMPLTRRPNQVYILSLAEAPCNPVHKRNGQYSYHINFTSSMRLEADIVTTTRYTRKTDEYKSYVARIPFRNKTKSVAWIVSHCKTWSKREDYVKALSRYIDVDIYGGCGRLKCERDQQRGPTECYRDLEKEYKFYLSFENSVCKDYVTEKFRNPLHFELVPVVLGGADYTAIAPNKSVIDITDFRTPKDLADYLHYLSNNETAYMEYFQWKNNYRRYVKAGLCSFCEIMTSGRYYRPAELWDVDKWFKHNACDNGLVDRILSSNYSSI